MMQIEQIDWNTGQSADVLIYARRGSWFGHQNNAESWPHLLVNTSLSRPDDFHNRSIDGPYIPISTKRNSAIVPRGKFKPLTMKIGETWSLYICTSLADFRYTLGTSIGKTFAANNQLRIMEGAGAADFPPFMGGLPEGGGVEYTFYAPRVFNGNLRYDYIADCPSEAPSSVYSTPVPTPIPSLTTSVSYTFYVEHNSDKLKGAITYDMSFGVRAVLDRFLGGEEDILFGYAKNHELVIEQVVANMVSPTEIGCELLIEHCLLLFCHLFVAIWDYLSPFSLCLPLLSLFRSLLSNPTRDLYSDLRRCDGYTPKYSHDG